MDVNQLVQHVNFILFFLETVQAAQFLLNLPDLSFNFVQSFDYLSVILTLLIRLNCLFEVCSILVNPVHELSFEKLDIIFRNEFIKGNYRCFYEVFLLLFSYKNVPRRLIKI